MIKKVSAGAVMRIMADTSDAADLAEANGLARTVADLETKLAALGVIAEWARETKSADILLLRIAKRIGEIQRSKRESDVSRIMRVTAWEEAERDVRAFVERA